MLPLFRQRAAAACVGRTPRVRLRCNLASTVTAADLHQQNQEILHEAAALTRSLYRLCMRSVKLLRQGNQADAAEFAAREKKQRQDMLEVSKDERLSGIISMLPPVQPAAELHARSEYYAQYTSENFLAESDCLDTDLHLNDVPDESQFARYFYHLRKGEKHRQWLLQDMKFTDPYKFDLERVRRLEERVHDLTEARAAYHKQQLTPQERQLIEQAQADLETYDSDAEAFSDDEDEDDEEVPVRYINRRRRLENEEDDD